MSISDNARERARIARLKALESEERVQSFGEVGDSRVVVINYDPDKKAYLVRTLGGQIGYAMNISGTQLGVGATVQATRKGNGFIIDYFDKSSGKGSETNDKGNDISKDAFNNQNNTFFGGSNNTNNNSNEGEDVWIAEADGSCTLRNYPTGQAPKDAFKTKAECRAAQDSDYNCEGDGVCKSVARGTGKYKSKAECEKALIKPAFTGGQCAGVKYIVTGTITGENTNGGTWGTGNTYTVGGFQTTGIGPIEWVQTYQNQYSNTNNPNGWYFAVKFANGIKQDFGIAIPSAWVGSSNKPTVKNVQVTVSNTTTVQEPPGGCGNPKTSCPTT